VLVEHPALRMFTTGTARRTRATGRVILAALRRISESIGGRKSGGAKKHRRSD
jgi:hypothetical protein